MDHPLIHEENKTLRKRVVDLFSTAYLAPRESNIVFVCGGNAPSDMRPRFLEHCKNSDTEFEIFQPEFSMENYFSSGSKEPFDIADFELLIGNLSKAIVIFPEAAGSFAETGYFSAKDDLAAKSLLVMDAQYQSKDSFISMGPAKKIGEKTLFYPVVQMDYSNPTFEDIFDRIRMRKRGEKRKKLSWSLLSDLTEFEYFCLIQEIVRSLSAVTIDDIEFILRALSKSHLSVEKCHQLTSILVGSGYLIELGDFGHLVANEVKPPLLRIRDGQKTAYTEIQILLSNLYLDADQEFRQLLEVINC